MQCFGSFLDHCTLTLWLFKSTIQTIILDFFRWIFTHSFSVFVIHWMFVTVSCILNTFSPCVCVCVRFLTFSVLFSNCFEIKFKIEKKTDKSSSESGIRLRLKLDNIQRTLFLCVLLLLLLLLIRCAFFFFKKNLMFSKSSGFFLYPPMWFSTNWTTNRNKKKRKQMKRSRRGRARTHVDFFIFFFVFNFFCWFNKTINTQKTIGVFFFCLLHSHSFFLCHRI